MLYQEFVLTTKNYIRTCMDIKGGWRVDAAGQQEVKHRSTRDERRDARAWHKARHGVGSNHCPRVQFNSNPIQFNHCPRVQSLPSCTARRRPFACMLTRMLLQRMMDPPGVLLMASLCPLLAGEWLVDIAPHYFDLSNFPQGEARRALERLYAKKEKDKSDKF